MSTYRQNESLYHDARQPLSLGCTGCPEFGLCGGLHIVEGLFDCRSFCKCPDPDECSYVCPRNLEKFINYAQEVYGYSLDNTPRCAVIAPPTLPYVVPHVFNRSSRTGRLKSEAVSVPLSRLFDRQTGEAKFSTKEEVAKAFGFEPGAALIINGVGNDQPIEDYWTHRRATHLPEKLAQLRPALMTGPNYSVFLNVPRWDNLHNMKRIAICWSELVTAGIPTALHLNARTDQDWQRWTDFVAERDEVRSLAFEFKTGAACYKRGNYHAKKLCKLAKRAGRDLQLVVRGGYNHLKEFNDAFGQVIFINTSSFMKTISRQRLEWYPGGKKRWRAERTPDFSSLDGLLQHNIETFARMASFQRSSGKSSSLGVSRAGGSQR